MPATQSSAVVAADRPRRPALTFGPFTFDPNSRLLRRGSEEIPLPPRVLGVLELLLDRAGDVVPRVELIDNVWRDAFVTDTSLAEAVSVLRQALGDDPQSPTYIQTLHRRGYRFVAPVSAPGPGSQPRTTPDDSMLPVSPSIAGQLVPWSAAVLCALAALVAVWQLTRSHQRQLPSAARFEVAPADGTVFDARAPALALSADGTEMAWSACDTAGCRLFVRRLDSLDIRAIPGTDGAQSPFFSSDGRWIAFFADGRLKKVALAGGAPVILADTSRPQGGVWVDREIIFAGSLRGGLMRVSADGGDSQVLTTPREQDGEVRHAWPSLVPNRGVVLFTIATTADDDAPGAAGALSLASGNRELPWRTLLAGVSMARAGAPDTIVFSRGNDLHAIAFDPARLATSGDARTVVSGVARARGGAHYALSTVGSLVYAQTRAPAETLGLSWWSPTGFRDAAEEIRQLRAATLAPDGTRVAGVRIEGTRADIWVADVERGAATRLTHAGLNSSPVWSPNSRAIYFAARTTGVFEIWRRDAEGISAATRVFAASRHAFPLAASPDGATLAFLQTGVETRADIWTLPLTGGPPRPLVQGPFDDSSAAFSPDSSLCAYQSAESGRSEIYVQRIRDGRRVVVSTDGGEQPWWVRDGLYYLSRGRLVRVTIARGAEDLRVASTDVIANQIGGTLAGVSPDGQFLVDRRITERPASAVMSLEWIREVRQLLGPPFSTLPR